MLTGDDDDDDDDDDDEQGPKPCLSSKRGVVTYTLTPCNLLFSALVSESHKREPEKGRCSQPRLPLRSRRDVTRRLR